MFFYLLFILYNSAKLNTGDHLNYHLNYHYNLNYHFVLRRLGVVLLFFLLYTTRAA